MPSRSSCPTAPLAFQSPEGLAESLDDLPVHNVIVLGLFDERNQTTGLGLSMIQIDGHEHAGVMRCMCTSNVVFILLKQRMASAVVVKPHPLFVIVGWRCNEGVAAQIKACNDGIIVCICKPARLVIYASGSDVIWI
jgi:hypothetical protein